MSLSELRLRSVRRVKLDLNSPDPPTTPNIMKVPFLDLKALHAPLTEEFDRAIREVIETSAFAGGPLVENFDEELASFCGSSYATGMGNGTNAHWLAPRAL